VKTGDSQLANIFRPIFIEFQTYFSKSHAVRSGKTSTERKILGISNRIL